MLWSLWCRCSVAVVSLWWYYAGTLVTVVPLWWYSGHFGGTVVSLRSLWCATVVRYCGAPMVPMWCHSGVLLWWHCKKYIRVGNTDSIFKLKCIQDDTDSKYLVEGDTDLNYTFQSDTDWNYYNSVTPIEVFMIHRQRFI
jgi:hypothetical protein